MALLFRNNAESTLASTASAVATTITVVDGSVFPSPGSDTFLVTLTQGVGPETSWEIVLCTARVGNDLTVTRAQEGTTAVEWPAGTKVSMRLTAGALSEKADASAVQAAIDELADEKLDATGDTATDLTVDGITSEGPVAETPVTGNAGTAYTINLDSGTIFDLTLDQSNCDFTFPAATAGRQFTLLVTLGGAGRTYTFPASVRWDADGAPDISTASGLTDRYVFQADGTYWLASAAGIGFDRS